MTSIEEIISRIETLEDLPISEEMLGAYYESKLSEEECAVVRNIIDSDLFLMNLEQEVITSVGELVDIDNCVSEEMAQLVSIELPEVFTFSDTENSISCNGDDILPDTEIEYTDLALEDICGDAFENVDDQFANENIE